MSSNNYYWKKCDEELGAVVTGLRTRKPSKKCQTDSTDDSSPLQNPILKPKAKTKPNQSKRKNDESYTKRATKKPAPSNQVANSDMKWVCNWIPSFFVFLFSICWLVWSYFQKSVVASASTSDFKTQDTTNMLGGSDEVEWVSICIPYFDLMFASFEYVEMCIYPYHSDVACEMKWVRILFYISNPLLIWSFWLFFPP